MQTEVFRYLGLPFQIFSHTEFYSRQEFFHILHKMLIEGVTSPNKLSYIVPEASDPKRWHTPFLDLVLIPMKSL